MSGTFAPAPGSAPFHRQVLAQASMESRLILRNGEHLLLAVVIPMIALVGGTLAARRIDLAIDNRPIDVLTPGVLALAVMSTAFTSLAIATGFERRYGLLKRLGASPLPRVGLLLGKVLALLGVQVLQAIVICGVALALGWEPSPGLIGVLAAIAAALLGTCAFAGLGLALAGTLRAEATLAGANMIYLLLLAGGAVVFPRDTYGGAGELLQALPSAAIGDAMRSAFIDGTFNLGALAILAAWALVGGTLAGRFFKWE
ncbi:ABC transporter permease [Nocardioides sp. Bht2]|uniref:ABC transporter permease n=1 Tax=Nocardioides sp. Bht2 TaxID=3392297 RepID=UPI0039B59411